MARHHSSGAFTFSNDAVADLRRLLGESAGTLTSQLQHLIREHLSSHAKSLRSAWSGRSPRVTGDGSVEIQKTIAAVRVLIRRIDEASPFLRRRLEGQTLGDLFIHGGNEWEQLTAFHQTAKARLQGLEAATSRPPRTRGRPKDIDRRWLAVDVAVVLRLGGVSITTSRKGKFARVLETVLFEAAGSAPDDMFRLVREVSRSVNEGTLEEVRHIVKRTARCRGNPSFWLRLASVH
jgi:hypothetical protein